MLFTFAEIKPLSKALLTTSEFSRKRAKSVKDEPSSSKRLSALDEIIKMEESRKKRIRKDHWLAEDIIVKVVK